MSRIRRLPPFARCHSCSFLKLGSLLSAMTPRVPGPDWADWAGCLLLLLKLRPPGGLVWSGLTDRMGVSDRDEEEIRVGSAALLTTRTEGGGVERPARANGCFFLSPAPLRRLLPHTHAVTDVESRYIEAQSCRGCYATH